MRSRLQGWGDRLRVLLLAALPQHAISRLVLRATRVESSWIQPVIRWFIRRFGVDMAEAAEPDPRAYPTFNAFFTRALRSGARPLAGGPETLVIPVDGRLSAAGTIEDGRLFQAKGMRYSAAELVGGDRGLADRFAGGSFATLYLAPGDYHRIHIPCAGTLQRMIYVPGRLFSVAPWTVRTLEGLFVRNERVCAIFETDRGPVAVVMVGAINVAAIETVWAGLVTPPRARRVVDEDYAERAFQFDRGDEIARFNMGSTVIVLMPSTIALNLSQRPGERVHLGERLGRIEG